MMRPPRVVAWMPADPSVRVMARATAESAVREAELRLVSIAPPPPQWASWLTAAGTLGVRATWKVVAARPRHGGIPSAVLAESALACLVVTDAQSLRGGLGPSLAGDADVYVVASGDAGTQGRMREPAVVVGAPDGPTQAHLLSVADHEAALRHRHLIVVHAQSCPVARSDHHREHRWLAALSFPGQPLRTRAAARVVVAHRSVTEALREHVQAEDVLVVGVHQADIRRDCAPDNPALPWPDASFLELLETPPCDLLLTTATGPTSNGTTRPGSRRGSARRGSHGEPAPATASEPVRAIPSQARAFPSQAQ